MLIYYLVSLAVGANLSIQQIVSTKDYALTEAARPAFGSSGLVFTVIFAIVATASGVVASVFSVSRMLAKVTEMRLVPHSHFGMPGSIRKAHTLLHNRDCDGADGVLRSRQDRGPGRHLPHVMDIAAHWGVYHHLRVEISANSVVLVLAMAFDLPVLIALLIIKAQSDPLVIYAAVVGIALVFAGERLFLGSGRTQ